MFDESKVFYPNDANLGKLTKPKAVYEYPTDKHVKIILISASIIIVSCLIICTYALISFNDPIDKPIKNVSTEKSIEQKK
jgi:hypothetical protein